MRLGPYRWIVRVASVIRIAAGLIDSLARPGGNIAGLTRLTRELSGKRLELLRETIPRMSRVGVLMDANAPGPRIAFKEYEAAALPLKVQLQSLEVRGPKPRFEGAFQAAIKGRIDAILAISGSLFSNYGKWIGDLAIRTGYLRCTKEWTILKPVALCLIRPMMLMPTDARLIRSTES